MSRGDSLARLREALEDHGCTVRGDSAQCPAHEDRNPSLSVSQGRDGAVLLCHAGCPTDAVLEALGMSAADLFDEPRSPGPREFNVIATYTYTDEHGAPLFYVERRAPKDFRQYQMAGGKRVNSITKPAVRRVPYRLPELLAEAARGGTAWLVEGEKDADRLRAEGFTVTTTPMGAGSWQPEYARYFTGLAALAVIADKDADGTGYRHAIAAAADIRAAGVQVEVLEAAGGCHDISGHLDAGYGIGDLADAAPPAAADGIVVDERNEVNEKSPRVPPPVADAATYRGILAEITAAAGPTTEADPSGIYASLQAGAGVLAGPGPFVQIGNVRHPLLIWPLLMGRTSAGRKGEATTISRVFLYRARPSTFPGLAVAGLSSGEGLIEQLRDDGPRKDDPRLLVLETEFASVMARSRREGNTLAAVSRQAWEGLPLSVMNRKQLNASASHIAIIGHIAPREFRSRLADTDLAGGTYNRYLPVYVERGKLLAIPGPVAEHVLAALASKLSDAIDAAAAITCITLGHDAVSLWTDELYPEFADLDDADDLAWSEFTSRAAPYCLRLAGLHAALDGRNLIDKDDLIAASAQIRYSVASARYVLDGVRRDPREERLRRAIDAAGQAAITRTEISALFSRNLPAAVLDELLAGLLKVGDYEVIDVQSGGRPAQAYRRRT